jgi:adenylate cyclase
MDHLEIERKFLVNDISWKNAIRTAIPMRQGYLNSGQAGSVRVRIADEKAWLNIKGATLGAQRLEFEYEVPVEHARIMLDQMAVGPLIEKTRYLVDHGQHTFEIDVFEGDNEGLVVAEIELSHPEESFLKPSWLGLEVTEDIRYYNTMLAQHPYSSWT